MNYLGLDYGEARIGVSKSLGGGIASPHIQIKGQSWAKVVDVIASECAALNIDVIVIGYPLNANGTKSKMCEVIERFVCRLKEKLDCKIELFDERYSSIEAENILNAAGKKNKVNLLDKVAATVILNNYLEKLERR